MLKYKVLRSTSAVYLGAKLMYFRLFLLLVVVFGGILALPWIDRANALTPLTQAEIEYLKNFVQLMHRNSTQILPAQKSDTLTPGDSLSTGRASLADLRFNDGSLARVGEQALFQFLPQTRDFKLSNGTMLLLIPPGNGLTHILTPNAAAAIRGSALFVRYNPETDTTVIGALTNSGIEVSNKKASQSQVLRAGQLMVVIKDKFQGLYDFDLRAFYETSTLLKGLDLTSKHPQPGQYHDIASVKAEINTALAGQSPVVGKGVVTNPSFVQDPNIQTNPSNQKMTTGDFPGNSPKNSFPINSPVETGELLQSTQTAATKPVSTPRPVSTPTPVVTSIPVVTKPVSTPTPVVTSIPVVTKPVSTPTPVVISIPIVTKPVVNPTILTP